MADRWSYDLTPESLLHGFSRTNPKSGTEDLLHAYSATLETDAEGVDIEAVLLVTTPGGVVLSRNECAYLILALQRHIEGEEAGFHVIAFDDEGWVLQHAADCRHQPGGLIACPYTISSTNISRYIAPENGRYRAGLGDHGEILIGDKL